MSNPILAHHILTAGDNPEKTALIFHGILGSAHNWRGFCRHLLRDADNWRFVICDLRHHGESRGFTPPHDLTSCARDVAALVDYLAIEPDLMCGHSFGGKVAMVCARDGWTSPCPVWVLDTGPGVYHPQERAPKTGLVLNTIRQIKSIQLPVNSRSELRQKLKAQGCSPTMARWMTTNLTVVEGGYAWRFSLQPVEEMLSDYMRQDLWPFLESYKEGQEIHFVRAGENKNWSLPEIERLEKLARKGLIRLHCLEESGHWLHVDSPDTLRALLRAHALT